MLNLTSSALLTRVGGVRISKAAYWAGSVLLVADICAEPGLVQRLRRGDIVQLMAEVPLFCPALRAAFAMPD